MRETFRNRLLFDINTPSKLHHSRGTTEEEAMAFATELDHRGIHSSECQQSSLAVRGSASLCVATGLGLMTTGDARSPKLLVARKHLRCYIGKPSFSASFFQKL